MSSEIMAYLVLDWLRETTERVQRKILKDRSNPLDLPETIFIDQYRLNKEAFLMVLDAIKGSLKRSSIPPVLQLAAALRFFAEGSYQLSVDNNVNVYMRGNILSEIVKDVINVLERSICQKWVKLPMNDAEKQKATDYFYSKYRIPGITGCIDATHIKIKKPEMHEHLYYNQRGFFSMNAMIICDKDMVIRAINATYQGSNEDAFVWFASCVRDYYISRYDAGDQTRLLGDSDYDIEPFLLTPFIDPQYNSQEYKFNMAHSSAIKIIERTIGILKSRFRCLLRTFHCSPQRVVKIINVCCALHNICRSYNVELIEYILQPPDEPARETDFSYPPLTFTEEGERIRNEIAKSL